MLYAFWNFSGALLVSRDLHHRVANRPAVQRIARLELFGDNLFFTFSFFIKLHRLVKLWIKRYAAVRINAL